MVYAHWTYNVRAQGREGYRTGARNPYAVGSPSNVEWAKGWHAADEYESTVGSRREFNSYEN